MLNEANREIKMVEIAAIVIPGGRRPARNVDELAESINHNGLLTPIAVTEGLRLVAGLHRIEACKALGWREIPALVLKGDALLAQLAELDENLVRTELTALERAEHLARRKAIYEALHPETRHGHHRNRPNRQAEGKVAESAPLPQPDGDPVPSFVADTMAKTQQSERAIQQDVRIANSIPEFLRNQIRDSPLADRKTDLLRVAGLTPGQQEGLIAALLLSPSPAGVVDAYRRVVGDDEGNPHELVNIKRSEPSSDEQQQFFVFLDDATQEDLEWVIGDRITKRDYFDDEIKRYFRVYEARFGGEATRIFQKRLDLQFE
jgi:ParB family chromosome partitioning protein